MSEESLKALRRLEVLRQKAKAGERYKAFLSVPGSMLPGHAHVEDSGKVRLCAAYVGADCETVDWVRVGQYGYDQLLDQMSQGVNVAGQVVTPGMWTDESVRAKDARIAQLETKLADAYRFVAVLEAENGLLRTERTDLLCEIAKVRLRDFASRAEAELVDRVEAGDRSFPLNALRHSR